MKTYVIFNDGGRPCYAEFENLKTARRFAGEFLLNAGGSLDCSVDFILEGTLNFTNEEFKKVNPPMPVEEREAV